ncbi:MAG: TldD/PmbA family protein [Rhodothermales bacterium]
MATPAVDDPADIFLASARRLADEGPALLGLGLRVGDYSDLFLESTGVAIVVCTQGPTGGPVWKSHERQDEGLGVRIASAERQGFAWTPAIAPHAWSESVARAAEQLQQAVGQVAPRPFHSMHWDDLALPPDPPDQLSQLEVRALLQEYADAALAADADVTAVEAEFRGTTRRTAVATSEGVFVARATTRIEVRVSVTLGGVATGFSFRGSCTGFGPLYIEPSEAVALEALEHARALRAARPLPAGPYAGVVAGGWGGVLVHEAIGHALEADVALGEARSRLKIGTQVAPASIALFDDPATPGRRGSADFDDEGARTGVTTLIEAGQVHAWLADRASSVRWGIPRTGSGRRQDFRYLPQARMSNLCLSPGADSFDSLIHELADGLYIRRLGGGRYDARTDRYTADLVEAYQIEQGRVAAPVRGGRLVGTGASLLAGIRGISNEMDWDAGHGFCEKKGQIVPIGTAMPALRVDGLTIEPAG